ncbi:MAG: hypothetical protein QXI90_03280 [Thermofilum sp.]
MAKSRTAFKLHEPLQRAVEDYLRAAHKLCEEATRALAQRGLPEAAVKAWSAVLHATAALVTAASGRLCSLSDVLHGEPVASFFTKICPASAEELGALFRSVRSGYCDAVYNGWISGDQGRIVREAGEYLKRVSELLEPPGAGH